MTIHSFFKAERGDPDWQFTPEHYFNKEFKIIDASTISLQEKIKDSIVLRQNPTDKALLAKHVKINALEQSDLDLVVINEANSKIQQIYLYDIHVMPGANVNFNIFVKDGKLNKHIIQVFLEDSASINISGLMHNTVKGDTEVITKIIHQGTDSVSNQMIFGMAESYSQTVVQSMTVIQDGACGSESTIENSNLILGKSGRCFGKPEVFVASDDVRSSYGSFTDYLNEDLIHYLQCRGLNYDSARAMLIRGFQNQAFSLLPNTELHEEVVQLFNS
jgi:Fe-S cluster assembly scaffold protein SufB